MSSEIRVLLVGFPDVGKVAHQLQFVQHMFRDCSYDPALGDFDPQRKQCVVDNEACLVESDILFDLDSDEYLVMKEQAIQNAHCFMLMFAINNHESFQKLDTYWNDILRLRGDVVDQLPMIVVGTKIDMESNRAVSAQEIHKFCRERGLQYMESSAKTRINIEESYYSLVRQHRAFALALKPHNTRSSNKCSVQ